MSVWLAAPQSLDDLERLVEELCPCPGLGWLADVPEGPVVERAQPDREDEPPVR
jgi:hypothetical protein